MDMLRAERGEAQDIHGIQMSSPTAENWQVILGKKAVLLARLAKSKANEYEIGCDFDFQVHGNDGMVSYYGELVVVAYVGCECCRLMVVELDLSRTLTVH